MTTPIHTSIALADPLLSLPLGSTDPDYRFFDSDADLEQYYLAIDDRYATRAIIVLTDRFFPHRETLPDQVLRKALNLFWSLANGPYDGNDARFVALLWADAMTLEMVLRICPERLLGIADPANSLLYGVLLCNRVGELTPAATHALAFHYNRVREIGIAILDALASGVIFPESDINMDACRIREQQRIVEGFLRDVAMVHCRRHVTAQIAGPTLGD